MKKIDKDGNVRYYNDNNQLHRTDGPAVECINGNKIWFINSKLHRIDGPAIECSDGYKEWYINGEKLSKIEFNKLKYQSTNDFSEGF